MQISTWARTRSSSRWKTGRRSRPPDLIERKSRSTGARFLQAATTPGASSCQRGRGCAARRTLQGGFGADPVLAARYRQAGIGDGEAEVLAGLVLADHLARLDPDHGSAEQAGPGRGR